VACTPSKADRVTSSPTVPTEPERTTTTNPYAVPPVIDAAYVNRVLAGLDAVLGDAARLILSTKTIPHEAYDRLKAVYLDPDFLQLVIDGFQKDIRRDFSGYKPSPGNVVTSVTRLINVTPTCIFAQVSRDFSPAATASALADTRWVALRPTVGSRDPQGYNSTNWAFTYDGYTSSRSQPPDPCTS